eukprot:1140477-Pelagomonas_calceolata.AAC.2
MASHPSEHGALHGHVKMMLTNHSQQYIVRTVTYLMLLQTPARNKHDFVNSSLQSRPQSFSSAALVGGYSDVTLPLLPYLQRAPG